MRGHLSLSAVQQLAPSTSANVAHMRGKASGTKTKPKKKKSRETSSKEDLTRSLINCNLMLKLHTAFWH